MQLPKEAGLGGSEHKAPEGHSGGGSLSPQKRAAIDKQPHSLHIGYLPEGDWLRVVGTVVVREDVLIQSGNRSYAKSHVIDCLAAKLNCDKTRLIIVEEVVVTR